MKTILDVLNEELLKTPSFIDGEGKIIKEKVKTCALNLDNELLDVLFSNNELKNAFFTKRGDFYVFDKVKFSWIVSSSDFLPDSYTSFKNKIGLVDSNGNFIKSKDDVALSFPYKDCVLEFDSTDENEQRDEIFLNENLASSQIDTLLESKAFCNAKQYDSVGTKEIGKYEDGNLLIKGNNLIALHSLFPRFEGRIQCMYWDILYNTSSDQIPYNDSFKHSSWLTMMKNRLEIAKKLLKQTGIIFIHLDSNEMAYLKVLMDEIFERKNFLGLITCKVKAPSGVASGAQMIFDCSEYILTYARNADLTEYNHLQEEAEVVDERSKTSDFYKYILESVSYENMELVQELDGEKVYRIKKEDFVIKTMDDKSALAYYNNYKKIFRTAALSGGREKEIAKIVSAQADALESLFVFEHIPNKGKRAGQVCRDLIYKNGGVLMLSDFCKVDDSKKQITKMQHITSIFSNDWWQGISKEGAVTLNNGKKPEILLKTLIEMATKPNDFVLDAYFGTGTTGAVALKMGRRFIGIEQLDEHFEKSINRLVGVINGDKSGISKEVKWSGGGSFTSCEIAKNNYVYIDAIKSASSKEELLKIFDTLKDNPFVLNYNVKLDELSEVNREVLSELDEDIIKKVLINLLDKNSIYLNYEDIGGENTSLSSEDVAFTSSFYKVGE